MSENILIGDKRLNSRRLPKSRVRVFLRPDGSDLGANIALFLVDLSESGACLAVKEAMYPSREVSVRMEGRSLTEPVVCMGNVVWCKQAWDGTFMAGIAFREPLPYGSYLELTHEVREYAPAVTYAP